MTRLDLFRSFSLMSRLELQLPTLGAFFGDFWAGHETYDTEPDGTGTSVSMICAGSWKE